ncbi:MAG: hypothetical protein ACR2G7_01460 [Acidimicrobiales bacterium]
MSDPSGALLPRRAPERLVALNALEAALAADTLATLGAMVGDGWPAESALDAYRGWLHSIIDAAVDQGCCEWLLEAS